MHSNIDPIHEFRSKENNLSNELFSNTSREALLERFMSDYQIRVEKDFIVTLTLPAGESPITFLQSSQNLSQLLFNRPHLVSWQLKEWSSDITFNNATPASRTICIKGFSEDACHFTKEEQTERGYANVHIVDLALAHSAYFLATKSDLFNRHISRALEGDLYFYRAGLATNPSIYDTYRYKMVTASKYL